MGGGGRQTSVQDSSPWAAQQPFLIRGFEEARNFLDSGGPQVFTGQRVADPSAATRGAMSGMEGFGASAPFMAGMNAAQGVASGGGLNSTGMGALTATARGDFLSPDSNPAFRGMLDQALLAARPSVDAAFASAGRTGSGAHANAFADAATRATTGLAFQNFVNERGNQMQAAGLLNNLGLADAGLRMDAGQRAAQLGLLGLETGRQSGAMQDALAQGQIDANMARFDEEQNQRLRTLAAYQGLLGGVVPGTTTTTTRGGSSGLMQGLGAGIGLLGSAGGFAQGLGAIGWRPFGAPAGTGGG